MEDHEEQHQQALEETGFWGRWGAGCIFLAKSTRRVMLMLRSEHVLEPLTYGTCGGAGDGAETPEEAVKRETEQECAFDGDFELIPLWVFEHPSGFKYHNYLSVVDDEFTPRLNWESSGHIWTDLDALPSPLHPGVALLMENAREKIRECIAKQCLLPDETETTALPERTRSRSFKAR